MLSLLLYLLYVTVLLLFTLRAMQAAVNSGVCTYSTIAATTWDKSQVHIVLYDHLQHSSSQPLKTWIDVGYCTIVASPSIIIAIHNPCLACIVGWSADSVVCCMTNALKVWSQNGTDLFVLSGCCCVWLMDTHVCITHGGVVWIVFPTVAICMYILSPLVVLDSCLNAAACLPCACSFTVSQANDLALLAGHVAKEEFNFRWY